MWPLSLPVSVHCWMNFGCERLAMTAVTTIDSGTEISATRASSGEIQIIMPSTPMSESTDVSSWLKVCCIVCCTLSTSLVTRLSSSPRGTVSKYDSGSRCSLSSTSRRRRIAVRCTTPLRIHAMPHITTEAMT